MLPLFTKYIAAIKNTHDFNCSFLDSCYYGRISINVHADPAQRDAVLDDLYKKRVIIDEIITL